MFTLFTECVSHAEFKSGPGLKPGAQGLQAAIEDSICGP